MPAALISAGTVICRVAKGGWRSPAPLFSSGRAEMTGLFCVRGASAIVQC